MIDFLKQCLLFKKMLEGAKCTRSLFQKEKFEILLLIYGLVRLFFDSLFLPKRLSKEKAQSLNFHIIIGFGWFVV